MSSPIIINSKNICAPLEVCDFNAEDSKQEHLITHTTGNNDSWVEKFPKRDKLLLVAITAMVLLVNFQKLGHILYPFQIFLTWIHELSTEQPQYWPVDA